MVEDSGQEYRDTMQEVMLELKLKTDKMLKKLKEEIKKNKVRCWKKFHKEELHQTPIPEFFAERFELNDDYS